MYAAAPRWIVPLGLLVGLVWVGLFRLTWRVYGETAGVRVVPALAIVLLECVFTGALLVRGLSRVTGRLSQTSSLTSQNGAPLTESVVLMLLFTVLAQWVFIVSIPVVTPWWPTQGWRTHFNFLYPAPVYRPLLLAPIWGRWGLLVAACVGRTARGADAATVAFCDGIRPGTLLRWALLPLTISAIYFARDGNYLVGVIAGLIVFGVAYLAAVFMARRLGGQTRESLHAVAQITQLAFLAVYRALWPLIHE